MERWYIKCPFCANEIKKWAKKCQFCEEFLGNWENSKDSIKSTKKWFWYRFLRKDLNLNKKWWHRLLKVIFFLLIAGILVETLIIPAYKMISERENVYKFVEPLKNRFTTELVKLPDLLNKWEVVYDDRVYWFTLFGIIFGAFDWKFDWISDDALSYFYNLYTPDTYYCSTKLADNFYKLKKITWIKDVRAYEWSSDIVRWNIDSDINKIQKYINDNYIKQYTDVDNIYCIAAKKYPSFDCLDFTRYDISDKYIFKEAPFFTRLSVITWIIWLLIWNALLICALSCVLMLIYYKFIIYIIYWNYKKE